MGKFTKIDPEKELKNLIHALTGGHIKHKKPHAYLAVDTFGTVWDMLPTLFLKEERGDAICISDETCPEEIQQALLDALMKGKYNLIIGITLLEPSDSPFWAMNLRSKLQDFGYQTSLNMLFVRPEISYLHLRKDAVEDSMEQHFSALKKMLRELSFHDIFQSFARLRLFKTNGECVYNESGRGNSWVVMEDEFARNLSSKEKDVIRKDYGDNVDSDEMECILSFFVQSFQRKQIADAHEYFEKHKEDPVCKEVTIPYWQEVFAQANGIDLSKALQETLSKMANEINKKDKEW